MFRPFVVIYLCGVALGCDRSPAKQVEPEKVGAATAAQTRADLEAPLAVVDGHTITVEDFQRQVNEQSPYLRPRFQSVEKQKELLQTLVRFEVLAKEAERRGYGKDPDVVRAMKQVMIQKLVKAEVEDKVGPESITDAELRAYFEEHKADYQRAEEVRVSAIVLNDEASAKKIATLAKGEPGATNKGFRELVVAHSTDADTRARGGDLRYLDRNSTEVPPEVVEAAFATSRTGEVVGPVGPVGPQGRYYILKQTGRKQSVDKSFEDVEASIKNRLFRDRRAEAQRVFIENLEKDAKVEVNEANLAKIHIEPAPAGATEAPADDGHGH